MAKVIIGLILCCAAAYFAGGEIQLISFAAMAASGIVISFNLRKRSAEQNLWSSPLLAHVTANVICVLGVGLCALSFAREFVALSGWSAHAVESSGGACSLLLATYFSSLPGKL